MQSLNVYIIYFFRITNNKCKKFLISKSRKFLLLLISLKYEKRSKCSTLKNIKNKSI